MAPGGRWMTRPVGFRSGRARQAMASSRRRSSRSAGSFSSRAIAAAWVQGVQALEPLAHPAAVPPGLRLRDERLEQPFAALGLGLLDLLVGAGRSRCAGRGRSRPRWSSRWPGSSSAPPPAMLAAASHGLRLHQRRNCSTGPTRRHRVGRPSRNRRSSSRSSPGLVAPVLRVLGQRP